jgi:hypothetical protein
MWGYFMFMSNEMTIFMLLKSICMPRVGLLDVERLGLGLSPDGFGGEVVNSARGVGVLIRWWMDTMLAITCRVRM